jgi:hypothetical protein
MLVLLWSLGCESPEEVEPAPPTPPATMRTTPALETITDARGWLTQRASLEVQGPAGERVIPLVPPMRIRDVRATAWHLFLITQRQKGEYLLEITDLASGTTCGTTLPTSLPGSTTANAEDFSTDVVRGEHLLYQLHLTDQHHARLYDVECRERMSITAPVLEISPDKAFLATFPAPDVSVGDEPVIQLYDLGVGIQLGGSRPLDPPARVASVTWGKERVKFELEGGRKAPDPVYFNLPR